MRASPGVTLRDGLRRGAVGLGLALLLTFVPSVVRADNYGSNAYGSDVYGSSSTGDSNSNSSNTRASSSSTNESTVVETESGLQVAINLSDGQAIPSTGYYITITPLNGEGKTFDKAEIYLDGILAYSGAPDSSGTLKWLWDTSRNPATKVKIIVYGPGSGSTTHEFNVTVTPVQASNTNQQTASPAITPATDNGWPLWMILSVIGSVVVLLVIVLWLIARRRRSHQPPSPTVFTPLQ